MPAAFSRPKPAPSVRASFSRGPVSAAWEAACPLRDGARSAAASLPAGKPGEWEVLVRLAPSFSFADDAEGAVAALARELRRLDADASVDLSGAKLPAPKARILAELTAAAAYRFHEFKTKKAPERTWHVFGGDFDAKSAAVRSSALSLARDLVNRPPHALRPDTFEAAVRAELHGKCEVFSIVGEDLEKEGFGGIWNVGRGSPHAPRLVWAEWRGNPSSKKWDWALVGKGVTFDAGGYNLKPTGGMEDMKCDMAGAAAVLGALKFLAETGAKANVAAFFPLAENMVSGGAMKPGDVLRMFGGQTVEVANTDAEGRLLLADTLSFAEKEYAPAAILDIATLTGAQAIALGGEIAAVVGPDSALNRRVQEIGWETLDRCWELPYHRAYFKTYESKVADFANGHWAGRLHPGTIQGGLFLGRFVKRARWAHVDIGLAAGTFGASEHPLYGYGATGIGVRLLSEAVARGIGKKK